MLIVKNADDRWQTLSLGPIRGTWEEEHIYVPFSSLHLRPLTTITLTSTRPNFLSSSWSTPTSPADTHSDPAFYPRVCLVACVLPGLDDRNETHSLNRDKPLLPTCLFPIEEREFALPFTKRRTVGRPSDSLFCEVTGTTGGQIWACPVNPVLFHS